MEEHLYDTITRHEPSWVLCLLNHLNLPSSSKVNSQDYTRPIIIYATCYRLSMLLICIPHRPVSFLYLVSSNGLLKHYLEG